MLEINHVYNMDCIEGMKKMDTNSIDVSFTSPPIMIVVQKTKMSLY